MTSLEQISASLLTSGEDTGLIFLQLFSKIRNYIIWKHQRHRHDGRTVRITVQSTTAPYRASCGKNGIK